MLQSVRKTKILDFGGKDGKKNGASSQRSYGKKNPLAAPHERGSAVAGVTVREQPARQAKCKMTFHKKSWNLAEEPWHESYGNLEREREFELLKGRAARQGPPTLSKAADRTGRQGPDWPAHDGEERPPH